ncbi:MAG: hypothetical protein AAFU67_16435, partial [Bacteroidota bacterium]
YLRTDFAETNIHLNDYDLLMRTRPDENHGLGWYGPNKQFNSSNVNGPVLYGFDGGALGTVRNGVQKQVLSWKDLGGGRVGIGTNTPQNKLDVAGGIAIGTDYSGTQSAPINGALIQGNVGIGVTNPGTALEVNGTVTATAFVGDGAGLINVSDDLGNHTATTDVRLDNFDLYFRPSTDLSNGLGYYGQLINKSFAGADINGPVLYGFAGGALGTNQSGTEHIALSWKSNGRVGIGTEDPQNKLDIEGGVAIGNAYAGATAAPTNGAIIEGNVGIGTNMAVNRLAVGGGVAIGSAFSGNTPAPTNGLIIEGKVGIGTISPNNKLDVEGGIRVNDHDIYLRTGSDINHGLGFYGSGKLYGNIPVNGPVLYGNSGGGLGYLNTLDTMLTLRWTSSGRVGIGTSNPKNKLDVEGGVAIGANYSGNLTAPPNGVIIEGGVGIGTNNPQNKLDVEGRAAIGTDYSGNDTAPPNGA